MTKQRKEIQKKSDRPSQKIKPSEIIDNDFVVVEKTSNPSANQSAPIKQSSFNA